MAIHPGSIWINNNYNQLPLGFWIATNASGIVAQDLNYNVLIAQITELGINLSDVTIFLVPKN